MSVLIDTSIWSLALRRKTAAVPEADVLKTLWKAGQAVLLGPVRQELLSGVRDPKHFILLRDQLHVEPDYPLDVAHFEQAAEFHNFCRSKGVQGSNVDFLLCSVAIQDDVPIFTADNDFKIFAKYLPIRLFEPSSP